MKRITILTLALSVAVAFASGSYDKVENISVPTNVFPSQICGQYYTGDGLGYNLSLDLQTNNTFSCTWTGCLGVYGTSTGVWVVATNRVVLKTEQSTGMLKDKPLSNLDVLIEKGDFILVNADDNDFFLKHGPSRYSCFHRQQTQPKKGLKQDKSSVRGKPRR